MSLLNALSLRHVYPLIRCPRQQGRTQDKPDPPRANKAERVTDKPTKSSRHRTYTPQKYIRLSVRPLAQFDSIRSDSSHGRSRSRHRKTLRVDSLPSYLPPPPALASQKMPIPSTPFKASPSLPFFACSYINTYLCRTYPPAYSPPPKLQPPNFQAPKYKTQSPSYDVQIHTTHIGTQASTTPERPGGRIGWPLDKYWRERAPLLRRCFL